MRSARQILFFFGAALFLGFVIFFRADIVRVFFGGRVFVTGFFDRAFSYKDFKRLETENLILRNEVTRLKKTKEAGSLEGFGRARVQVYSNYPFNDKSVFVMNFGRRDGAAEGMAVVSGSDVILGKITRVKNTESEVQTVFDSSWISGVTIGVGRAQGVLKGGSPPKIELVTQEAEIKKDDLVFNTSSDFPLNAYVARVEEAKRGSGRFWTRIIVKPLFQRDGLDEVFVLTGFP